MRSVGIGLLIAAYVWVLYTSLAAAHARAHMADACWGSRDVFAVVEVRDSQELNKLVLDQIQRLEGVRETNTHIALD